MGTEKVCTKREHIIQLKLGYVCLTTGDGQMASQSLLSLDFFFSKVVTLLFGFASYDSPNPQPDCNVGLGHFQIRPILSTQLRVDVHHP